MNEKELQDIEFEYAPYTDEGSQQVKALVAEVRRLRAIVSESLEWYKCGEMNRLEKTLKGGIS